jgi:hypothetical protein
MGLDARRGQQFKGGPDSPDVIVDWPDWWKGKRFSFEVKRKNATNLRADLDRARLDAPPSEIACVWQRPNAQPWYLMASAGELFAELVRLNYSLHVAKAEVSAMQEPSGPRQDEMPPMLKEGHGLSGEAEEG